MGEKTGGHLRGEADEGTGSPEPQSCGVRVQRGGAGGQEGVARGGKLGLLFGGVTMVRLWPRLGD